MGNKKTEQERSKRGDGYYKEWAKIRSSIETEDAGFDPDKYRRIYKNSGLNLEEEIRNLRDEWNRADPPD
ncbi:MAG: hypothetical protein KAW12_28775 [Candidatus Aminicenantes bacterium]|nr:hypothetical protein [Candidatus Aminicenantes bacterium]